MVVEAIDAPWAGVLARFRWFKRRWICREHAYQIATFIEYNTLGVHTPGAFGRPGDPEGDWSAPFRGNRYRWPGQR